MRLPFVFTGILQLFASIAVGRPILVIDNINTREDGGSFEILTQFESQADPPLSIGGYSIGLRVDHFDGTDGPFFFESHNLEPRMVKLGESFWSSPAGELNSGDSIQITALSDGNGAVSIEDGTRLVRIDYSIAASTDYTFDVTIVKDAGNPRIPTQLGVRTPILTSATIAFAVPEPTKYLGLPAIAVLFLFCRRTTAIGN